jgi:hypothetical protein
VRNSGVMSRSANRVYGLMGADGARESGLTALMYTSIANFAVDAVLAVSLAGTLFFSAAEAESRTSVAAYLLVTIAPFALLAPLIGPALDRIRTGRRLALSLTFAGRVVLAAVLLQNFNSWMLYPAALGMLVLSKSYGVLKSSVTPRVAPEALDLVRANARLTIAGHIGGSLVAGGLAAAIAYVFDPQASLWLLMVVALSGIYGCALIPSTAERGQDEVTVSPFVPEDPVPAAGVRRGRGGGPVITRWRRSIRVRFPDARTDLHVGDGPAAVRNRLHDNLRGVRRQVLLPSVRCRTALDARRGGARPVVWARSPVTPWVRGSGFPGLRAPSSPWERCRWVPWCVRRYGTAWSPQQSPPLSCHWAARCRRCAWDAAIQSGLDQAAQASAFGISETALQLSWVFGGTLGILLPPELTVGMAVLAVVGTVMYANVIAAARGVGLGALIGRARSPR